MTKHIIRFASTMLALVFLLNPMPAHAALFSGVFRATPELVLVKNADNVNVYSGSLPEAKQREARYKTVRTLTAYSSTPDQTDSTPFTTANGTQVHDGIVAANWLKFGTRVRIPDMYGDKVFIVTDRMHPRFDNRMDIWFETRAEAKQFGLRHLTVEVL